MTYQVLARKWRPQDFSSLVGQEPVVTALRNALRENRIAQAYLFSGIRGVGKTTAARVLAKALNCERRADSPTGDPCNACRACEEITAGSSLDVIEVDAATYSKVEQVRELTESLRYAPANDRHKVVVLDEVHRLSRQAFDALLKIVEEPPAHLVFIFATTELDAVPATILSRCQQFQFRRVPSATLAEYLRTVCDHESIETSDAALRMIARAGEGSVRDAIALLDQLATFGNGTIRDDDASQLLGGLDSGVFHRLLGAILAGDGATIRAETAEIERNGWDPFHVFGQFLAYVRDALHLAMGGAPDSIDLPAEEAQRLGALAGPAGYENLLRLLQLLLGAEETVRRSEFGALALEITWLRGAELPKLVAIENLLAGRPAAATDGPDRSARAAAQGIATAPNEPPKTTRGSTRPSGRTPADADGPKGGPAPAPATAVPENPLAAFLGVVRQERQPLAAHLAGQALAFEDGVLEIPVPRGDALLLAAFRREANVTVLDRAVRAVWGSEARWSLREVEMAPGKARTSPAQDPVPARTRPATPATEAPAPSPLPRENEEALSDRPTVQTVLTLLGGTVEKLETDAASEGGVSEADPEDAADGTAEPAEPDVD